MKIGEIAQQARVSKSIIRYYEGKGVLPRATRDRSGYRDYGDADLARIRLVTGARRLGCSFTEIRAMVAMQDEESAPSSHLLELLCHKVDDVSSEIDRLKFVQKELRRLRNLAARLAHSASKSRRPRRTGVAELR